MAEDFGLIPGQLIWHGVKGNSAQIDFEYVGPDFSAAEKLEITFDSKPEIILSSQGVGARLIVTHIPAIGEEPYRSTVIGILTGQETQQFGRGTSFKVDWVFAGGNRKSYLIGKTNFIEGAKS